MMMPGVLFFVVSMLAMAAPIRADDLQIKITVAFEYGGDIYVTDFSGDPVSITSSDTYEMIPAWSPDGTQIAFLSGESRRNLGESRLHIMTLESGETHQLSELTFSPEATLTWSPNGRYIAATTLGMIFIVDVETGEGWQIPSDCGTCSVSWLPDSSGLIFESGGELFSIDLDGDNLQQLTSAPPNSYRPALSPVSNRVLFASSYENVSGLYSVSLDDLTINRFVELSGYEWFLHLWSPDGHSIAISVVQAVGSEVDVPGGSAVYIINADGTDMRIVTGEGRDSLIGWANDSQHILYYEGEPGRAGGTFFAINITNGTKTHLSNATMDRMCFHGSCRNFVVRPSGEEA